MLAAAAVTLLLVAACGGAVQLPHIEPEPEPHPAPGPGPEPSPDPEPITGLRFDLSGAVGLQIGGLTTSGGIEGASASSNLVKVLANGALEDALAEGTAVVLDFFVRNGQVYVLFAEAGGPDGCVLGAIDAHGEVACVDAELRRIDIRSIQFDAHGAIYYRGWLDGGDTVIRRSIAGAATDYFVARDAITVFDFRVTRDGWVLLSGFSEGGVSSHWWIRAISPSGSITNLPFGYFVDYLPDGTLLTYLFDGPRRGLHRLAVHDGFALDPRPYCASWWGSAPPRFDPDDVNCGEWLIGAAETGGLLRTVDSLVALGSDGLFRLYPVVERIDLPITRLTNGALRLDTAVVAGYDGTGEPAAFLVDTKTGSYRDILKGARIEILRLLLQLDASRVVIYGLDLARNQPVLAEYSIAFDRLEVAPVAAELASTFEVLDLTVGHVPPAVSSAGHEPAFDVTVLTDFDQGKVHFDASGTPGLAWIDALQWDFGDGTELSGDYADDASQWLAPTHRYAEGGTYTVTVTGTTFLGVSESATREVEVPMPTVVASVAAGWPHLAMGETGHLWSWGRGYFGNGTDGTVVHPVAIDLPADAGPLRSMCTRYRNAVVVDQAGRAWTWGHGEEGALGDGGLATRLVPGLVAMPDGVSFQAAGCGSDFTIALAADGRAWAWGINSGGVLGIGGGGSALVPTPVAAPEGVVFEAISTSTGHTLALDAHGHAWAWGSNGSGQLGDDSTLGRNAPVAVAMPEDVTFRDVAAGSGFSIALDQAGHAWAWGAGSDGQLGSGTSVTRQLVPAPVAMPASVTFTRIAAGSNHALALDDTGRAWAWGHNDYGQVGDGTLYAPRLAPVPVMAPEGVTFHALAAGIESSLAIDLDGRVWGWGSVNEERHDRIVWGIARAEPELVGRPVSTAAGR